MGDLLTAAPENAGSHMFSVWLDLSIAAVAGRLSVLDAEAQERPF
ncbi:MAG: hypothetical protein AAGD12_18060 [Pseudomonadota bacterium]